MSKRRTKKQKIKSQIRRQRPLIKEKEKEKEKETETDDKIIKMVNKDIKADPKTTLIIKDLKKTGWVCLLLLLGLVLIYWRLNQ